MTDEAQDANSLSLAFNRQVSADLESALSPGGILRPLVDLALADPRMDVQLRRNKSVSWVSFYCGLTSILDVVEKGGQFRFAAHLTHQAKGRFNTEWLSYAPAKDGARRAAEVAVYLRRMLAPGGVSTRYTAKEGALQASIARLVSDEFGVFQREAVVSFPSKVIRTQVVEPFQNQIWAAIQAVEVPAKWWPGGRLAEPAVGPGLSSSGGCECLEKGCSDASLGSQQDASRCEAALAPASPPPQQ